MMVKNNPPNIPDLCFDPNLSFLIRLRLCLQYNRKDLAQLLGISYDTVWQWETGRRASSFTWEQIIILEEVLLDVGLKFSDFPPGGGPPGTAPTL